MNQIKFEQINGTLCRMVEPELLTENAQYPCVVKLIGGNDTSMDRYKYPTMCYSKDFDAMLAIGTGSLRFHYTRYEILGYPVEEGSHWWALYQMQIGKQVCHPSDEPYFRFEGAKALNDGGYREVYPNNDKTTHYGNVYHYDDFIKSCIVLNKISGWQLYEPEPAKEPIADCDNCKHVCANSNIDHCHMYEPKPAYAVGDWIQYAYPNNHKFDLEKDPLCNAVKVIHVGDNAVTVWIPSTDTLSYVSKKFITKILKPSEVVVHIGCLRGTVRPSYWSDGTLLTDEFILYRDDVKNAIIAKAMLDEPTLTLVKELLEKQEGEKK